MKGTCKDAPAGNRRRGREKTRWKDILYMCKRDIESAGLKEEDTGLDNAEVLCSLSFR